MSMEAWMIQGAQGVHPRRRVELAAFNLRGGAGRLRAAPFARRSGTRRRAQLIVVDATTQQLAAFKAWCDGHGVEAPKVDVFEEDNGYRGLRTTEAIAEGEVIIRVPWGACLTSESPELQTAGGKATAKLRLYERLLGELHTHQTATSSWAPYLAVMPETPVGAPGFSAAQLMALEGSGIAEDVAAWLREVDAMFPSVAGDALAAASSLETWRLAVSLAHSRGMALECGLKPDGEVRHAYLLAPFADFLNHTPSDFAPFVWGWKDEALCVWAEQEVAAHTEALISYGSERSNDPLLQYYGFVIPDNPHETVKLFESIPAAAEWFAEKWRLIVAAPEQDPLDLDELRSIAADMVQNTLHEQELTGHEYPDHVPVGRGSEVDDRLLELFETLVAMQFDDMDVDDDVEDMAYMCVCYRASELLNEYRPPLQADDSDYNDTIISQFCQLKMEVLASYAEVWNQMER